jgi:hypothetical protein
VRGAVWPNIIYSQLCLGYIRTNWVTHVFQTRSLLRPAPGTGRINSLAVDGFQTNIVKVDFGVVILVIFVHHIVVILFAIVFLFIGPATNIVLLLPLALDKRLTYVPLVGILLIFLSRRR